MESHTLCRDQDSVRVRFGFGSDSVRMRFGFGSDWVQIRFGFGSNSVRIRFGFSSESVRSRFGFGSYSVRFRFGSERLVTNTSFLEYFWLECQKTLVFSTISAADSILGATLWNLDYFGLKKTKKSPFWSPVKLQVAKNTSFLEYFSSDKKPKSHFHRAKNISFLEYVWL